MKVRRSKKPLFFLLFFSFLGAALLFYFTSLLKVSDKDIAKYNELSLLASTGKTTTQDTENSASQKKENVKKFFRFYRDQIPLEGVITSAQSQLLIEQANKKSDYTELFEDVSCCIQERLFYRSSNGEETTVLVEGSIPYQHTYYLIAKNASYDYQRQHFQAEQVTFYHIELSGHQLTTQPSKEILLMEGEAPKIDVVFAKEDFQWHAKDLKIHFLLPDHQWAFLSVDNSAHDGKTLSLIGNVHMTHPMGIINTQNAVFLKKESKNPFDFAELSLNKDVLIQLKEGKSLRCDTAHINYGQSHITLNSTPSAPIVYTDTSSQEYPIEVQSLQAEFQFDHSKQNTYTIASAKATGAISLKYGNNHISSESLLFDHTKNLIELHKNIEGVHGGYHLKTEDQVHIYLKKNCERTEPQRTEFYGGTLLTIEDPSQASFHTLTCPGKVAIDHEKYKVYLEPNEESKEQIIFHDRTGYVYADCAEIEYTPEMAPKKILLHDHVRLSNNSKEAHTIQYALSDYAEYDLAQKKMLLSSNSKKSVLFYDEINNLKLSAPAIQLIRQPNAKMSVKGIGDVRFTFNEQEIQKLLSSFKTELSSEGRKD